MAETPTCPRIIVVEDDVDQLALICETLRLHYGPTSEGSIVPVRCGGEALAQDLSTFDIMLLDYNLPDMNGLCLLREATQRADLPVIIVTGVNVPTTAAEAIQKGASDYVVKIGDYLFSLPMLVDKNIRQHRIRKENARLQSQLQQMLQELQQKNLQLQESMAKLELMAATDHLTGLSNRRSFSEQLERSYGLAVRYDTDLTCCMCDLDHYKQINDALGHQKGDELLMLAADVIRHSMRTSDLAARYGGDEFVLLLPHTSVEQAMAVCDRIRDQFAQCGGHFTGSEYSTTMSIGVASLKADCPVSADALVTMADRALYFAKEHGKDRIVAFGQCGLARTAG